jgi:hypothetical protein
MQGATDGLGSVRGSELPENGRDVEFDRLVADPETLGDALVRQPFGQKLENVDLSRGERLFESFVCGRIITRATEVLRYDNGVGASARCPGAGKRVELVYDLDPSRNQLLPHARALTRVANQDDPHRLGH